MSKKLKHIYPNSELFHSFFHRPEGLTYANGTGSCSWNNNSCYSYSSEIGYADFENKIFYFRSGSRSSSTSKHQNNLRCAIPSSEWFIVSIDWYNWSRCAGVPDLSEELESTLDKLKANKDTLYSGIKYLGNSEAVNNTIKQVKEILTKTNQLDKFNDWEVKALEYQWTAEEINLYGVKKWATDNEFIGSTDKKIKYYNDTTLKQLVEDKFKAKKSAKQLAVKKRAEQLAKKELENLEKWLRGEYSDNLYNIPVHLRISKSLSNIKEINNSLEVITTLGARVPLKHAELLFKKFRQCVETNAEWKTNGHSISVGNYKVTAITKGEYPNGELQWCILAGCHVIFETEIVKFVKDNNLNWYESQ